MIDRTLPIEFDNGRPGTIVDYDDYNYEEPLIRVRLPEGMSRYRDENGRGGESWWYNISNGVWNGGDARTMWTIRNVLPKGPDRIAEMFS